MPRSTEQVFLDHINALSTGDFPALLADYAGDTVLMTMDGVCIGVDGVRGWFMSTLAANPNFKFNPTGYRVQDDYVIATWSGESDVATIPQGVDTFVIRDDRIRLQTLWFTATPK
jgi:hypothetical protein